MTSPLDEVFESEQRSIQIAEYFGIASQKSDSRNQFAQKCIQATFNLSVKQCQNIFNQYGNLLANKRPKYPWLISRPFMGEDYAVTLVRDSWESHIHPLKARFRKAIHIAEVLKELEDNDPIGTINQHLNQRFDIGNKSLQKDLKPVLTLIADHQNALLEGISLLAWKLGLQDKDYAQKVVTAFTSNEIPQKGLLFGITLIAQIGGAPIAMPSRYAQALRLSLNPPLSGASTAEIPRLSETKTVLGALGLATVSRGSHFNYPQFSSEVRDLLIDLLNRVNLINNQNLI